MVSGVELRARSSLPLRSREAPWIELTVATAAVMLTVATGAFLHFHPGPNAIDRLGFRLLPTSTNSSFFRIVTWFGTAAALVIGSVSAATVAWFSAPRSGKRALACLLGPASAAAVNQFLIKPQVGRLYVGELSFASGSVIVIAGISATWVLAAPRRLRPVLVPLGLLAVGLMTVAVVVLRWHYPTDALVGALFAVGMVTMVDGATRVFPGRPLGRTSTRPATPIIGGGTSPEASNGQSGGFLRHPMSAQRVNVG